MERIDKMVLTWLQPFLLLGQVCQVPVSAKCQHARNDNARIVILCSIVWQVDHLVNCVTRGAQVCEIQG